MPFPFNITTVAVHGQILNQDGTAAKGTVTFAVPYELHDTGANVIVGPARPIVATLSGTGEFTVQLPATDDPDISPTGWTYQVHQATTAGSPPAWPLSVPVASSGTGLEFADLSPAQPVPTVQTYALFSHSHAGSGTVGSVNGQSGDVVLTFSDVGAAPTVHTHSVSQVVGLQTDLDDLDTRITELEDAPPSGGSTITVRQAYVKTGNVNPLPNTGGQYAPVAGFVLSVPAAIGDYVELGLHGMRNVANNVFLDAAVITGASTIKRFLSTGTATGPLEGDPGWYLANSFINQSAPRGFTVTSDDLDGSNVRFAIVCNGNGTGILYASTDYPFYWQAKNLGVVQ